MKTDIFARHQRGESLLLHGHWEGWYRCSGRYVHLRLFVLCVWNETFLYMRKVVSHLIDNGTLEKYMLT